MKVKLSNYNTDSENMGIAPVVAAGISLVPSLLKGLGSFFGSKKSPPPPPPPPPPTVDPKIIYMGGAALLAIMTMSMMRR